MSLDRPIDGTDGFRPQGVGRLAFIPAPTSLLAQGTLACPSCDAPVRPHEDGMSPADAIECPFCERFGRVRDFLTLGAPTRPARVEVRIRLRA